MRILGVGDPFVDLTARVSLKFLENLDIKPGSRFVIDEEFFNKYANQLKPLVCRTGGSTASSLISIACLGLPTAFIGSVGTGEYGQFFRSWLKELGVEDLCVSAAEGIPTSLCLNMITPNGERTMAVLIGASKYIPSEAVKAKEVAAASHVLCECYQLFGKANRVALKKTTKLAREEGKVLALGLSDVSCIKNFRQEVEDLVGASNIVFGNEFEWMEYYQTADFAEAVKSALAYCQTRKDCIFAMTHGEDGAYLVHGEEKAIHVPAVVPKVTELNLAGAGDSFAAGFLYAYARGAKPELCGKIGAAVASRVIAKERATIIAQEGKEINAQFEPFFVEDRKIGCE